MKSKLTLLFGIFSWLFSGIIASVTIFTGNISFWYDPARDMLSAWNNLQKLTLIGPTSGIPGIFYGPYWIWWLSLSELFSKNPEFVTFIAMTLPYQIVFFTVLLLFGRLFGKFTSILLWLLFFAGYEGYFIQVWNPFLAPVLFLVVIYLFVFHISEHNRLKSFFILLFAGFLTGIAFNLQISFSTGFIIGCLFYVIILGLFFEQSKAWFKKIAKIIFHVAAFFIGIVCAFFPFFLFEVRHGFLQTKTALVALSKGGAVVAQHGLSRPEILMQFFLQAKNFVQLPIILTIVLIALCTFLYIFFSCKKSAKIMSQEKKLLLLLCAITFSVLAIYLLAKNPVWNYHFVGFEVIWLLYFGLLAKRIPYARVMLAVITIYVCFVTARGFVSSLLVNPLTRGSLYTQEYTVHLIQKNAGNKTYAVFAYSPSIYMYDYSYLFRFLANKNFSYDPGLVQREKTVYLILPKGNQALLTDFIHFRTPDAFYKTVQKWQLPSGTTVIKRVAL